MARKGQKFNTHYSKEFRERVMDYAINHKLGETARKFNVPIGTIGTWNYHRDHIKEDACHMDALTYNRWIGKYNLVKKSWASVHKPIKKK